MIVEKRVTIIYRTNSPTIFHKNRDFIWLSASYCLLKHTEDVYSQSRNIYIIYTVRMYVTFKEEIHLKTDKVFKRFRKFSTNILGSEVGKTNKGFVS